MISNKEIECFVKNIIIEYFDIDEEKDGKITGKTNIRLDLNGDSLDLIEILMSIEEKYDICISDEELKQNSTIDEFVSLIREKIKETRR